MPSSAREWRIFCCTSNERSKYINNLNIARFKSSIICFQFFIYFYGFHALSMGQLYWFPKPTLVNFVSYASPAPCSFIWSGQCCSGWTRVKHDNHHCTYWYLLSIVNANDHMAEFAVFGRINTSPCSREKTPAGYCMVPPFLFTQSLLLYTVFNDFVHLTVWDVVINGQLAPNIAIQLFHLDVWLGTSGTAHSFKVSKTR